jgi:hypothetical protein
MLVSAIWDKDGILLLDYLANGATIMTNYYMAHLNRMEQQLVSKRRGNLSKEILFLQGSAVFH